MGQPINLFDDAELQAHHQQIKEAYASGKLALFADLARALAVHTEDPRVPAAHRASVGRWKLASVVLILGGIASVFFVWWLWSLLAVLLGFGSMLRVRNLVAASLIETALKDAEFFRDMASSGVLKVMFLDGMTGRGGPNDHSANQL
jgi:hypothetical protein